MIASIRQVAILTSLCAASVAVACSDNAAGPQPGSLPISSFGATRLATGRAPTNRGIEQEILRLESVIPGIGGMYVEGANIVVYAPMDAVPGRIVSALARASHEMAITSDLKAQLARGEGIRVRSAKFSLSQLISWEELLMGPLSSISELTGIDADESTNRVRINLADATKIPAVQRIAATAGIPPDAIAIEIVPKAVALAGLRGTWRPTGGGIQIYASGGEVCAVGFNVTTSTGLNGFVTAGHCARGNNGPTEGNLGELMYQPTFGSDYLVGAVKINHAWHLQDPGCGTYPYCTLADALFVKYDLASTLSKRVAFTAFTGLNEQGGSITLTGWWDNIVAPSTSYFIGQQVDKVGPATGWTRGTISQTCVNIPVQGDFGAPYVVLCSDAVTGSRAGNGDSGAPVFTPPPAGQIHQPLNPIGLLFAATPLNGYDPSTGPFCSSGCTYYFSHWSNIEAHLGVSFFPN